MTRVRVGFAAVLALMLVIGSSRADTKDKPDKSIKPTQVKDKPPPDRPPPPPDRPPFGPGRGFSPFNQPLLTERDLKALDLKEDQKTKVEKIVKNYNDKQKKVAELMDKARKGDQEARREIEKKGPAFFQSFQKSRQDALDKVRSVLNDDQKKKLDEIARQPPFPGGFPPGGFPPGGPPRPGQILPPFMQQQLKLTKEQKEELDKLQKDVDAKLKKLLTDEQKKMLERFTNPGGFRPGGPPGGFPPPRPPRD